MQTYGARGRGSGASACRSWREASRLFGLFLVLAAFFSGQETYSKEIFVAPNGLPMGDGTREYPLDLASALSRKSPAEAGDIIWLRGGVYVGKFRAVISGTSGMPITVASYPGEWAVIDSGLA